MRHYSHYQGQKHSQKGVGLIEVLVAIMILALSILGFSAVQMRSVQTTTESVDRAQTLVIMRSFAEKIRANSSQMETYASEFHKISSNSITKPTKLCDSQACTPEEIARADVYNFSLQLNGTGLNMDLHACPSSGGTKKEKSVMYSYCLVASWGDTNPTVGADNDPTDGAMDCLTTMGTYHPKATCMFMETN